MSVLAQALLYAITASRLSDTELQPIFEDWHKKRPNARKWNLNHASVMTENGLQYRDFRTHRAWQAFKAGFKAHASQDCQQVDEFRRLCEHAEQQLTGIAFAFYEGFDNMEAWCISCGLAPDEWTYIKDVIGVEWLPEPILAAVEDYMKTLSTPTEPSEN